MQDDPSSDDQLINLEAPASKFDTMTLDDLNDDDFDPRAGDQTGPSDQVKKNIRIRIGIIQNPDPGGPGSGTGLAENLAFDPRAGDQTGQQSAKVKKTSGSGSAQKESGQCPAQDAEPD